MRIDDLLGRLENIRPRGTGRYAARCPAHPDKSPSLSVSTGKRGLLLHCFAGCSVDAICTALGLTLADLFYDREIDPRARQDRQHRRAAQQHEADVAGAIIDACRHADQLIHSRRGLDVSSRPEWHLSRVWPARRTRCRARRTRRAAHAADRRWRGAEKRHRLPHRVRRCLARGDGETRGPEEQRSKIWPRKTRRGRNLSAARPRRPEVRFGFQEGCFDQRRV